MANNILAVVRALNLAGVHVTPDEGVRTMRVDWRRTQDGKIPRQGVLVLIMYTVDKYGTQPATFDVKLRKWRLPSVGIVLDESEVQGWTPGPWDYSAEQWSPEDNVPVD